MRYYTKGGEKVENRELNDAQYYNLMMDANAHGMSVDQYNSMMQKKYAAQQEQFTKAVDEAVKRALAAHEAERQNEEDYKAFCAWKAAQQKKI